MRVIFWVFCFLITKLYGFFENVIVMIIEENYDSVLVIQFIEYFEYFKYLKNMNKFNMYNFYIILAFDW
jgi:hypothetical protein